MNSDNINNDPNNYNNTNTINNNNNNNNNNRENNNNNNNIDHSQRDNLPQRFTNLKNWKYYIKKVVGTHSLVKDANLKTSLKFAKGFKNG